MGDIGRSIRVAVLSAVLVAGVAVASGCGESSDHASTLSGQHSVSPSTQTTKPAPNIDPVAPPYTPVVRDGVEPTPDLQAKQQPFTKPVTYPDHVSVRILAIHQDVTTGHGPGELAGRPVTTMRIRFTNGGAKPVDLNQVVVTVIYGSERRLAQAIYLDGSADFHGTVAPGRTTVASYTYSVPTSDLGHVTMKVDFDALHAAATFTGAVT